MEHASIASFAKFALDLTAHGAPPELLLAAHSAAADEVRHARACLSLAAACSGRAAVPSAIEFPGGRVDLQVDLAAFAADVVREGCIGETLAAIQAAEQLVGTKDVATARVLATIVEDESSHAELAWRTVRWALDQGGDRVRRAVAAAFADADAMAVPSGLDHVVDLTAWGFPRSARIQAALERAVADVIRPAAEALLNR
jgi:1,2-phenylacetyl-CoA epoxidase catalytic subunit